MPPEHELFQHDEQDDTGGERDTYAVRTFRTYALQCFWHQREQSCAEQRTCGEAHEVRQHSPARAVWHEQENAGADDAENAAKCRKYDDQ